MFAKPEAPSLHQGVQMEPLQPGILLQMKQVRHQEQQQIQQAAARYGLSMETNPVELGNLVLSSDWCNWTDDAGSAVIELMVENMLSSDVLLSSFVFAVDVDLVVDMDR